MKRKSFLILIVFLLVPMFQTFSADQKKVEIGVVENLGSYIPLNTELIDENGNKYSTYDLGKDVKDGDTVKLTAKVKAHNEYLGIKFTQIYYCKVINVWNVKDDILKFNI